MTLSCKALVLRHWQAANDRDWTAFAKLLADDLVYQVPQTREQVRGAAGYLDFFRTWPGDWRADVQQVIADEGQAVTVLNFLTERDNPQAAQMTGITFFEVQDGRITRVTDHWPEPYEPPPRASVHVTRY
ncbi:nuclear transport factor 2 family protein [Ideonella azotifigens]|uniref:Nuclear transport factor 2 family protein n=1 Tax=Ideonella azotifigens TaxID=513160 RepID=A0ABN1JPM6_9BURK|nr:nuclear transport factor 2 family protein [Ideonella azotifigens]MCD2340088.1 nuclear transport factor 2 family protein [Ideonella azotifigens]